MGWAKPTHSTLETVKNKNSKNYYFVIEARKDIRSTKRETCCLTFEIKSVDLFQTGSLLLKSFIRSAQ
jgi:hypothetical protein